MSVIPSCTISIDAALKSLKKKKCIRSINNRSAATSSTGSQTNICTDSRAFCAGDIFLAITGSSFDGHDFVNAAIDKTAALVITQQELSKDHDLGETIHALVFDTREAWTILCAQALDNPQESMRLIGITGTNGKTSTLWMLKSLLETQKVPLLCIGTLGIFENGTHTSSVHTTPDPPTFFRALAKALKKGITTVAMEVSSHSIVQKKMSGIVFSGIAWTSFSRDHLDFHKSMDNYWKAKWNVFENNLSKTGYAVICSSICPSPPFEDLASTAVISYGLGSDNRGLGKKNTGTPISRAGVSQLGSTRDGTYISIEIEGQFTKGTIPYWGSHNLENFLAAMILATKIAGTGPLRSKWSILPSIPGRLERVWLDSSRAKLRPSRLQPAVFIDFAHTPDALRVSLLAVREFCNGKIFLLFGCGGDRDKGKRPEMAAVAEETADVIFLSSDNPRLENTHAIIEDICGGFSKKQPDMIELDRKKAIGAIIDLASSSDVVLIAGKGHEAYQVIGKRQIPFNDYAVAREHLSINQEQRSDDTVE